MTVAKSVALAVLVVPMALAGCISAPVPSPVRMTSLGYTGGGVPSGGVSGIWFREHSWGLYGDLVIIDAGSEIEQGRRSTITFAGGGNWGFTDWLGAYAAAGVAPYETGVEPRIAGGVLLRWDHVTFQLGGDNQLDGAFGIALSTTGWQRALQRLGLMERDALAVRVGMTAAEVRAAWGDPEWINRTIVEGAEHAQWVYGHGYYVYLRNGVVTAVQTRERG